MAIEKKMLAPYDNMYYVSRDGDVYSMYSKKFLKHATTSNGHHRVDIHGKHMMVHRLVYLAWRGNIPDGLQINHLDDNKSNNCISNLYAGTQKENIADCFLNENRVGHVCSVTILDKQNMKTTTYPSIKDFLKTTGHSAQNGCLTKVMKRNWFKNRYEVIERKGVSTIESYKSIRAAYDSGVENKAFARSE